MANAFDMLEHEHLFEKLFCYGMRGNAYKWLKKYQTEKRKVSK